MTTSQTTKAQQTSLPKLLAALAAGAKSVNNLPSTGKKQQDDDEVLDDGSENDSNGEEDDDEFGYQMAFPEFKSLCLETRSSLSQLLNQSIKSSMGQLNNVEGLKNDDKEQFFDFDDPRLWDNAAETCESILERVDIYIQNVKEGRAGLELEHLHTLRQSGRNKGQGEFDRLVGSLVDMAKPQITYEFADEVQNARTDPFRPTLNQFANCTLEIVEGHGLDSKRYGKEESKEIIAPKHHYLHPYKEIIENFKYKDEQLLVEEADEHGTSGTLNNQSLGAMKGIWIDTEHELTKLVSRIEGGGDFQEIAIDLEAHNYRSFSGFVCTMQLSLRRPKVSEGNLAAIKQDDSIENGFDFIIDTLALRNVMNKYFAPIFANPNIVKVMHGADSDVQWLQRDFGIYIVNLFDTGRASRVLPHFSSAGLAYLLKKYANVDADKKHQLSDWRQRPLPDEMLQYAISDTMYLLDIYDKMKAEIKNFECDEISIKGVLDASRTVCLTRYDKEPFNRNGYKYLMNSKRAKRKNVSLSQQQEEVLKHIYEWRDATARAEDESLQYVCPNSGLVRIATVSPDSVTSLQACMNPLPPLVLQYSNEILRIIQNCLHNKSFELSSNLSPQSNGKKFVQKNIEGNDKSKFDLTQTNKQQIFNVTDSQTSIITYEEIETPSNTESKANRIELHPSNKNFKTNRYSCHSLEMKPRHETRGYSVDGLGAAKAVFNQMANDDSEVEQTTIDIQTKIAHECADRIRRNLMEKNSNLLGLVKVSTFVDSDMEEKREDKETKSTTCKDDEVDTSNELPKSIKEVYRISNRREKRTKPSIDIEVQTTVPDDSKIENSSAQTITMNPKSKRQKSDSNDTNDRKEQHDKEELLQKQKEQHDDNNNEAGTFDYSKLHLGKLQMFDPNAPISDNPFFEGVARSGGLAQYNEQKQQKKRRR